MAANLDINASVDYCETSCIENLINSVSMDGASLSLEAKAAEEAEAKANPVKPVASVDELRMAEVREWKLTIGDLSTNITELEWAAFLLTEEAPDFVSVSEIDEFSWEDLLIWEQVPKFLNACFQINEDDWDCLLFREVYEDMRRAEVMENEKSKIKEIEWYLILSTEEEEGFDSDGQIDEFIWAELLLPAIYPEFVNECSLITEGEWNSFLNREIKEDSDEVQIEYDEVELKETCASDSGLDQSVQSDIAIDCMMENQVYEGVGAM